MRLLYSLLLALAAPILLLGLYKKKEGKPSVGNRWKEHFGFTPKLESTEQPIWLHAVSVGEVLASKPIIQALQKNYPLTPILVTTTTSTGAAQAEKIEGISHRYMPIDFSWCITGFLRAINPSVMLIMETELWPNTLYQVKKTGTPIVVMNARLSEKSMLNYQKVKPIFNLAAPFIDRIVCQFDSDKIRFLALNIPQKKLSTAGSVKFDLHIDSDIKQQGAELANQWNNRPTWIAASTHEGEDKLILQAHQKLLKTHPHALLVLVPRHPERFNNVFLLAKDANLNTVKRSSSEKISEITQVYLGDTMGEMLLLFAATDIAFMAGSLLGKKVGGHNLLEPAALEKPILTGPSYFNFQVIGKQMLEQGACVICNTPSEIAKQVAELIDNPQQQKTMGSSALQIVKANQGAVEKTIQIIDDAIS